MSLCFPPRPKPPSDPGILGLSLSSQPPDPSPAPPIVLQGEGVEPEVQKAFGLAQGHTAREPFAVYSFIPYSFDA